jgi:4-hydroxybenzoate polyprenyltransferase
MSVMIAVVSARMAAMSFNRLVDATIDAENPRTHDREIPSGKLSPREGWGLVLVSTVAFVLCAAVLGWHCVVMVPPVLLVLFGYSLLKRFTSMCHFVLGLALALAPGGVWYALTARWAWDPVWLMGAVLTWVAGFDILYSCQDIDFDRKRGLFSLPSYLGFDRARNLASVLHLVTVVLLSGFGEAFKLGHFYTAGVVLFALALANQHLLVARRGLPAISRVFFSRNGTASITLLVFVVLDRLVALR